jgi:catechol 2,3-dioxygenase-like lactoylglutathione lyase family enzyme
MELLMGSNNVPLSKHIYHAVFGFADAGDRLDSTEYNGRGLGFDHRGVFARVLMVGRQELVQIGFWNHSEPMQKPIAESWRPNDIGYCRFGISVPDFDATLARLSAEKIRTITKPVEIAGQRRVCFPDPTLGIPVEIMEEGETLPGQRERYHDLAPAVVYATVSVTSLEEARGYFCDVVGLKQADVNFHSPDDERLWGLPNARRKTLILRGEGTVYLEIVQYEAPVGRPRPIDDRLNITGFKTLGICHRDPKDTEALFHRVKEAGLEWTIPNPPSYIPGNHVVGAVAHHMKTYSVPPEYERVFGFMPEKNRWAPPFRADSRDDTQKSSQKS